MGAAFFLLWGQLEGATLIFEIKVLKWNEHNPNHKKSHKKTMIANNFTSDAKINELPMAVRWLFLHILLLCGENAKDTITLTERQVNEVLKTKIGPHNALAALQQLQLVSVEKNAAFELNRIKLKGIKLIKEKESASGPKPKNPDPEKQGSLLPAQPAPPHQLFSLWNEHRGKLPEARSCAGSRLKRVKLRWPEQTPEAWGETIKRMAASNFCNGKNDRAWKADFEFLLKPDTWAKVNEGKYDNNQGSITTAQTRKYDKLDELEQKWSEKAVGK